MDKGTRHFEKLMGKIRYTLQITHTSEFNFNIGRHIKTLKPNVVPSVFTFIKRNHQKINHDLLENLPYTEFVKPNQK